MPMQVIYPIIQVVIVYYSIGLNNKKFSYFLVCNAIMICAYFYGVSYGLCISIIVPKLDVAMALLPLLTIPQIVLGGFFVNSNNVPKYLIWIEYISMFKYSFQAAALNEFDTVNFDSGSIVPLDELGISESMAVNFIALIVLGIGFRIIALVAMHVISSPSKPKLNHKIFKNI